MSRGKKQNLKLYEKFQKFLDLFSECDLTVKQALEQVNLTMKDFLELKRSNAYFRASVEQILNERALLVEEANFNSAIGGNVEAQKFFLKNRDQERWKDKVESDINNKFTFDTPEKQLNAVFGILGIKELPEGQQGTQKNPQGSKDYMEVIEVIDSNEENAENEENQGS